jgi:hypothetical protein
MVQIYNWHDRTEIIQQRTTLGAIMTWEMAAHA